MKAKNCFWCEYFYFESASPGYSEYTPSSPMEIRCEKEYWSSDDWHTAKNARQSISKAEKCSDFKRIEE